MIPPEQADASPASPAPADLPGGAVFSSPIETAEMLAEIETELGFRRMVYPKRIEARTMGRRQAERRLAVMAQIGKVVDFVHEHGKYFRLCLKHRAEIEKCLAVLEAGQ